MFKDAQVKQLFSFFYPNSKQSIQKSSIRLIAKRQDEPSSSFNCLFDIV